MSRNIRLRTVAGPLIALLLLGCEGLDKRVELCRRCEEPAKPPPAQTVKVEVDWQKLAEALEGVGGDTIYVLPMNEQDPVGNPPPQTAKVEVDWQKLAEALEAVGAGGGESSTVSVGSVNVTVSAENSRDPQPGGAEGSRRVDVEDWDALVKALASLATAGQNGCADCGDQDVVHGHDFIHNVRHTIFDVRFAPPWFNADQRSLFTSYVVFPKEAKLDEWVDDEPDYESCAGSDSSAAVCPDRAFHKQVMGPFLEGLARCARGEKKVKLRIVGFASSSGLDPRLEDEDERRTVDTLETRYDEHVDAVSARCPRASAEAEKLNPSQKFNLLIANQRAAHAAAMLRTFALKLGLDAFDIEDQPWCSHAGMAAERRHDDRNTESDGGATDGKRDTYDVGKGLMNRRAEVRLVDIPGCLNLDPDNRIDVTPDPDTPRTNAANGAIP